MTFQRTDDHARAIVESACAEAKARRRLQLIELADVVAEEIVRMNGSARALARIGGDPIDPHWLRRMAAWEALLRLLASLNEHKVAVAAAIKGAKHGADS